MRGFSEWLMAPAVGNTFSVYTPGWLVNVPAAKFIGAGGGVFNLIRRRACDAIGGHSAQKASVVDDILLGLRAKRAGFRCGFALALDAVSVRMYHGLRETIDGFTKNLYFGMGSSLAIALPAIALTLLDGLLPTTVLLGGLWRVSSRGQERAVRPRPCRRPAHARRCEPSRTSVSVTPRRASSSTPFSSSRWV